MIANKLKSGFSLIETMVAIAVLVMVITGPITLAANSLKSASISKNNFIAANLAQEGIELMRLYRTNNAIQGKDWLEDIMPPGPSEHCNGSSGHTCYIDAKTFQLNTCNGSKCAPALLIDSGGFYNYISGTASIFKRNIVVDTISGNAARVTVTIDWNERFGDQSITLEEIIHDWIQ